MIQTETPPLDTLSAISLHERMHDNAAEFVDWFDDEEGTPRLNVFLLLLRDTPVPHVADGTAYRTISCAFAAHNQVPLADHLIRILISKLSDYLSEADDPDPDDFLQYADSIRVLHNALSDPDFR